MPRVTNEFRSFNGGALSPLLALRGDTDIYQRGCKTLINGIPTTQGAIIQRKGSYYVNSTKSTNDTRSIPFIFSEIDSFVLEFGNGYIRFYSDNGIVTSGGSPYEIVSPYLASEVFDIKYVQRGDIMYLSHPNHRPQKITRFGTTNWTISDVDNLFGPVRDRPSDQTVTMQCSSSTGTITVTASSATFDADMVGGVWSFGNATNSFSPYAEWEQLTAYGAGVFVFNGDRLYKTTSGGTSGNRPPLHEDGTVSDGSVDWTFVNFNDVGYARMTGYTSDTVATFEVQRDLSPTIVTGDPNFAATTYWNEGAWSSFRGYPRAVAFFEQRLCFGGTDADPVVVDMSQSNGRFEIFDTKNSEDDAALRFEIDGDLNTIQTMISNSQYLTCQTYSGLAFIGSGRDGTAVTPTNVVARVGNNYGSNGVQPIEMFNTIQFVHTQGKKIFQGKFNFSSYTYDAEDLTVNNPSITGNNITEIAIMEQPYVILWCVKENGQLAALVQENNQNVLAWTTIETGTKEDGTFDKIKSVSVIPKNGTDQLWLIVQRTISGVTKQFVEYIELDELEEHYTDCSVLYDGASTDTATGLSHLDGANVKAWTDGYIQKVSTPVSGSLTTAQEFEKSIIGLPYNVDISPMLLTGGVANGEGTAKKRNIHEIAIWLYKASYLKMGADFENLQIVPLRSTTALMTTAPQKIGEDYPEPVIRLFNNGWGSSKNNGSIVFRIDEPLPCTIVGIEARYVTNDK